MLQIGDVAPDFALSADSGEIIQLSELRGHPVLIFFYPKAETPGCTTQACGLRDNFSLIWAAGGMVLGISPDPVNKLAAWQAKETFGYPLLSDPDHTVAEAYGVWGEKRMYGKSYMGIIRSHFFVGPDGTLEDVQIKISPQDSVEKAVGYFSAH